MQLSGEYLAALLLFVTIGVACAIPAYAQGLLEKLDYTADQAVGAPGTPSPGKHPTAWMPLEEAAGEEWLLLRYAHPIAPASIHVHQTNNAGTLTRISVLQPDGDEHTVWQGVDPLKGEAAYGVSKIPCSHSAPIQRLKLHFDTTGAVEHIAIDAVGIEDSAGRMHWAVGAASSSSYGYRMTGFLRHNATIAELLLASGRPEDIALAQEHLEVVLSEQETREGHVNRGNFSYSTSVSGIPDRNAACFVLYSLIPMMIEHGDRLPEPMHTRVIDCIRMAVEEVISLDVAVTYSNIAALSCAETALAGELLEDAAIAEYGYAKTREFADVMFANGNLFEYNAPTYARWCIIAFNRLAKNTRNEDIRILARTINARLAASYALHIHQPTGRLAAPHGRAYYPSVTGTWESEASMLQWWVQCDALPSWITRIRSDAVPVFQLDEGVIRDWDIGMTTYVTPEFAMGTGSREISRQTNVFSLHYPIPGRNEPGVVFARYLIDDTWFGDPTTEPDRSKRSDVWDCGMFYGVQDGPRAIGLYAPRMPEYPKSLAPCSLDKFTSAKGTLIWAQRDSVDAIWVNDHEVEAFPAAFGPDDVAVTEMGDVLFAIRPLTCTNMGFEAPMRLNVVENNLILEMYNYLGEMGQAQSIDPMSRFSKGMPQCGFYVEAAKRADYASAPEFAKAVASGNLHDEAESPFTAYMDDAARLWTVEYARSGRKLGIQIDLVHWKLMRRWNQDGDLGWPAFDSPLTQQNASGRLEAAGAVLQCGKHPAWICANPDEELWVAGYYGPPAPLTLRVPGGKVKLKRMGTGVIVWDHGNVSVEASRVEGPPRISAVSSQSKT